MSFFLLLKTAMIWFIIAVFAVANGIFREKILAPYLGEMLAVPLSGITLSIIIFTITYLCFNLLSNNKSLVYLYIGIQWVIMTLVFEFVFGHFIIGKSWSELLQVFNILEGNLFTLALLSSLFSPILVSLIKK
jgi:hypothetical protein